jgi:hypothetical protein
VENAGGNAGGFLGEELAGVLIERDQSGGVGRGDVGVGPIDSVRGSGIELVTNHDRGAG